MASHATRGIPVLLLALACAGDPGWSRDGATRDDLERDRAECLRESGSTAPVMNYTTSRFLEHCLVQRGWTRGGGPPPAAAPAAATAPDAPRPSPRADLSFDECFARCRELTTRSPEECFDVCLAGP